jgi:cytoskeletal protein CcmA (bactofilin family)
MLRSDSLFGKKDSNSNNNTVNTPANPPLSTTLSSSSGIKPMGSSLSSSLSSSKAQESSVNNASTTEVGSKLIVGPNIKLKGEIIDCDTLVVEGRVEATMDSRVIQIAEKGAFKGSAEIDVAEIRGEFDGELTVREKLVIFATGKVSGKVRYGKLVIEDGGQIAGDVQVNTAAASAKRLNVA